MDQMGRAHRNHRPPGRHNDVPKWLITMATFIVSLPPMIIPLGALTAGRLFLVGLQHNVDESVMGEGGHPSRNRSR